MSAHAIPSEPPAVADRRPNPTGQALRRRFSRRNCMSAQGEPMVWLTGGALALCLFMIAGLLLLVLVQGGWTFWPQPVVAFRMADGSALMGEVVRRGQYRLDAESLASLPPAVAARAKAEANRSEGLVSRRLVRTGNFDLTNTHFHWVDEFNVRKEDAPGWALVVERLAWGRFYGIPKACRVDGRVQAASPEEVWDLYNRHHGEVRARWRDRQHLEKDGLGRIRGGEEAARLGMVQAGLKHGTDSPQYASASAQYRDRQQEAARETAAISKRIVELDRENDRYQMVLATAGGGEKTIPLAEIVRAYPANQLEWTDKLGVYLSRWGEFLSDDPREANSEGGVFPAIFGTVTMTLLMSLAVVPFGVLAALYLREYARAGVVVSAVRIAINNLAGVPSIVFGVFGLGFFCYIVGGTVDQWFFEARLPNPTFGTGGLLWASLTLALLTLPVVIVATEEALAAVPGSMREGSYACGASKWQTIRRIVLPRALPGIMTGMILAMARGAGEVAPLMLVGAVKLAPSLPVDGDVPFVHPERSFMHLGFHIFDLGFQSQNSEAAKPMVFTTTLLLIAIVAALNLSAICLRSRLRRRFVSNQF
ncbi:MAG: phosphate ABC transporter permease PstA [Pirellulales bacterium]